MLSLTFGEMPSKEDFAKVCETQLPEGTYLMTLRGEDYEAAARIINQGIDSHLEGVQCEATGPRLHILDVDSIYTFIRRCSESDDDIALDLASSILTTLDIEWV